MESTYWRTSRPITSCILFLSFVQIKSTSCWSAEWEFSPDIFFLSGNPGTFLFEILGLFIYLSIYLSIYQNFMVFSMWTVVMLDPIRPHLYTFCAQFSQAHAMRALYWFITETDCRHQVISFFFAVYEAHLELSAKQIPSKYFPLQLAGVNLMLNFS